MIICVDGTYREATPEEQAEIDELIKNAPVLPKSDDERITELEINQLDLAEAIATLYEGDAA